MVAGGGVAAMQMENTTAPLAAHEEHEHRPPPPALAVETTVPPVAYTAEEAQALDALCIDQYFDPAVQDFAIDSPRRFRGGKVVERNTLQGLLRTQEQRDLEITVRDPYLGVH